MVQVESKRTLTSALRELPLKFLLLVALFILILALFSFIAHEVVFEKKDTIDNEVNAWVSTYTTETSIRVMKFFTVFGSSKFLFPVYSLLVAFFIIRHRALVALNIALIASSGTALSFGLKRLFRRPRPNLSLIDSLKTYSFPSGHALSSFIFCSILVYLLWRADVRALWKWILSILLFLFTMAVGLSRIILKVHYPTDVVAGFCLGFLWVTLSFYVLSLTRAKSAKSVNLPLR